MASRFLSARRQQGKKLSLLNTTDVIDHSCLSDRKNDFKKCQNVLLVGMNYVIMH